MNYARRYIKCPCGKSDGNDDIVVDRVVKELSHYNPDKVVVVETRKCDICGRHYNVARHFSFHYEELVTEDMEEDK